MNYCIFVPIKCDKIYTLRKVKASEDKEKN